MKEKAKSPIKQTIKIPFDIRIFRDYITNVFDYLGDEVSMIFKTLLTVLIFSLFTMAVQASDMVIGYVKMAKGEASIVRGNDVFPARINEKISRNDVLKTGTNSALGVTLKDDTLIAMGSNSEVIINEFNLSPAEGKVNLLVRMLRGCVAFTSGIIGKISPETVKFSTPMGDIALRGTRFAARLAE